MSALTTLTEVVRTWPVPLWLGLSYALGSIPFGLLLAFIFANKDVRKAGSGNIGATNVARVVGKKLGVLTLVLDAAKGALPVILIAHVAELPGALAQHRFLLEGLVGLAALLGHCFPIWLKFRGGKGVATGLGVLLFHRPEVAGVGLLVFLAAYVAVRLVSAGSLVAMVAVIGALLMKGPVDVTLVPFGLCAVIILIRHQGNIRRLWQRSELRV